MQARPPLPRVVLFYRLYAGAMVLLNAGTLALGIALAMDPDRYVNIYLRNPGAIEFLGWFFSFTGSVFIALPATSLFFSNQPWAWGFNLAMIILGIFFGCMMLCLPAGIVAVPLAFAWFKPEVRAWYDAGRKGAPYGEYSGPDANYDYDRAAAERASANEGETDGDDQSPPNPY